LPGNTQYSDVFHDHTGKINRRIIETVVTRLLGGWKSSLGAKTKRTTRALGPPFSQKFPAYEKGSGTNDNLVGKLGLAIEKIKKN